MNAGNLDQPVTIEAPPATRDGFGDRTGSWTTFASVWAQAQPLRGRELFAAGTTQSEATVRFRIRYRDDVTSAMRVVWRGKSYAIVGDPIDVDGAQDVLELMCSGGVSNA